MKNMLLALVAFFLVASADAQKPKTKAPANKMKTKTEHTMKDQRSHNAMDTTTRMANADTSYYGNNMPPNNMGDSSKRNWGNNKAMTDSMEMNKKMMPDSSMMNNNSTPTNLNNSGSNQARSDSMVNPAANRNINPGDKEVKVKEKAGKTKIKHNKEHGQKTDKKSAADMPDSGGR